uniref:Reverse transcriptase Ty1/copia-type domain-containing protein n=1 Tax=Cannabis sativa TaxID=3483 RepID=A0A803NJG6_CANSA
MEIGSPTPDMTIVTNKWLFRIKYNSDGSVNKLKARLIVSGFQQTHGVDFFETYNLVIKPCTIRIMFTLATTNRWDIQQVDINNVFLNGQLTEDVYMTQPQGFVEKDYPHYVCKLNKVIYGLKQAPRAWFDQLNSHLL